MKLLYPIFILLLQGTVALSQQTSNSNNSSSMPSVGEATSSLKLDELIVQSDGSQPISALVTAWNSSNRFAKGIKLEKTLSPSQNIYLLNAEQILDREAYFLFFKQSPQVRSVSWNMPLNFRETTPNDEFFPDQWNMELIGATKVWDVTTGGTTVNGHEIVVAVLDKGFEIVHPDLIENLWVNESEIPGDGIDNDENGLEDDIYGWNFHDDTPTFSVERHGTAVAGLIGASGDNEFGISGINWNVKIMYLTVTNSAEAIAAFNYVLEMRKRFNETGGKEGAFVVVTNGSFGIDTAKCEDQPGWGAMYDPLGAVGVLSVAATANGDWNVDEVGDIPTDCPSEFMIAVTNTDQDDNLVPGSAYGKLNVDLSAPGRFTLSTIYGSSYSADLSGTSFSCPHVTGSIALLYSVPCYQIDSLAFANPMACSQLMRDAILKNTTPVPSLNDKTATGGRLNVYEGMKYLHAYCIAREDELEEGDFKKIYVDQKNLLRVFPSPTSDNVYIDYGNIDFHEVKIRVFNMLGQEMMPTEAVIAEPFMPQTVKFDVSEWSKGIYVVNIYDLSRKISVKFVKD